MQGRIGLAGGATVGVRRRIVPLDAAAPLLAVLFTLFDASATWAWLRLGVAIEGNPLVRGLIELLGPASGLTVRAGVGTLLVLALVSLTPRHRWAEAGLVLVTGVLGAVGIYHVTGAAHLLTA